MIVTMRRFAAFSVVAVLLGMACGFAFFNDDSDSLTLTVTHYNKYGTPVVDVDRDTLLESGFSAGSTVEIRDSQGHVHQGIVTEQFACVFTGDYFINYSPTSRDVTVGLEYVDPHYEIGDRLVVTRTGTDDRAAVLEKYSKGCITEQGGMSDETFTNFREVTVGNIAEGRLFRSSSPFYPDPRYPVCDALFEKYGVNTAVDVADTSAALESRISSGAIDPGYAYGLYENGGLLTDSSGVYMLDDQFTSAVQKMFRFIADDDGPYLLFCDIGKDRTGMMMMVLEGLMGATIDEIIDDYMLSYTNLFGITDGPEYDLLEKKMADRTAVILFDTDVLTEHGMEGVDAADVSELDPHQGAVTYLKDRCGVDDSLIDKVVEKLSS